MAEFPPLRYVGTEPEELSSMLETLPATKKELQDAAEAAIGKQALGRSRARARERAASVAAPAPADR